jgi:hypothetical protein
MVGARGDYLFLLQKAATLMSCVHSKRFIL